MSDRVVYIPNKAYHDYSDAERYGELRFLTEGVVNRFDIEKLAKAVKEGLADAQEDDYLMISSLAVLNAIGAAFFAHRFARVNFLLFKEGRYVERILYLS